MDRELLHDGVRDGSSDGAEGMATADDQTPPEEMDVQAISPRQRLALEAFCKGGTIGDAAKAANVTRQTLHRWRAKYPHFDLAMSSWGSACLSMAESQLAELASRAVGALSNAIDKGDANTARAVLRSLGVLRTYQPLKAPDAAREQLSRGTVEQEKEMVGTLLATAPSVAAREPDAVQEPRRAGITPPGDRGQEKEAVAKSSAGAVTETRRTGSQPAGVLRHQNVTSESAKEQKPAILAGKAGSAIGKACDSALQDATGYYQMLRNVTGQDALPARIALAS